MPIVCFQNVFTYWQLKHSFVELVAWTLKLMEFVILFLRVVRHLRVLNANNCHRFQSSVAAADAVLTDQAKVMFGRKYEM